MPEAPPKFEYLTKQEDLNYEQEGFAGWMLFGLLSTSNFLYYSDLFYSRYINNKYSSDPFVGFAMRTGYGAGQWFRVGINWLLWMVIGALWLGTLGPLNY